MNGSLTQTVSGTDKFSVSISVPDSVVSRVTYPTTKTSFELKNLDTCYFNAASTCCQYYSIAQKNVCADFYELNPCLVYQ